MGNLSNLVDFLCKTLSKTMWNYVAKLCEKLTTSTKLGVKLYFPTKFFKLLHALFHRNFFPINNQSFPLFHTLYYYYY